MAGTTHIVGNAAVEEKKAVRTVLGGSVVEGLASGFALVAALLGVTGIMPEIMLPVAVIIMGAAFLSEGIAILARYSRLLAETSKDRLDRAEFSVGVFSEFFGGIVGIVLGVTAIAGSDPSIIPAAVIVYGVTLMLSSGVSLRLNNLDAEGTGEFKRVAREALSATAFSELILGISAVLLGIMALVGAFPDAMSLAGILVVAFTGLVTGAAITTRMLSLFRS